MPANDVDVIGTFTVNQYKVSYMLDDNEYKTYTQNYGDSITAEPAPQKEGHTFSGWSEAPAVVPAHDVVIEGTFTVNTYKVNYYVDDSLYTTIAANYGTDLALIDAPTKEGYTFSGWSELPATMPANDVDVVGTFTVNPYTVTYMVDGEEYRVYTQNYGDSITAEPEPQKEGHTFSGWSEEPAVVPSHDVVIEGSFTVNTYKVTFVSEGKVVSEQMLDYGTWMTLPEPLERDGFIFEGWTPEPLETVPSHDVTYEAVWTEIPYAVEDVNHDGVVDSQDVLRIYEWIQQSDGDDASLQEDVNGDGIVDSQDVLCIYEKMREE